MKWCGNCAYWSPKEMNDDGVWSFGRCNNNESALFKERVGNERDQHDRLEEMDSDCFCHEV